MFSAGAASGMYICEFATINLEPVAYALMQIFAYINIMYLMVFAFVQRHKIAALIERLTEMYNERKKIFSHQCFKLKLILYRLFF